MTWERNAQTDDGLIHRVVWDRDNAMQGSLLCGNPYSEYRGRDTYISVRLVDHSPTCLQCVAAKVVT